MREVKPPAAPPRTFTDKIGDLVDRCLYAVAPARGAERMAVRAMWREAEKTRAALESAETDRINEGKWLGSRLSPVSELELDLDQTRQRSRELYKCDSTGGAVDRHVDHVVDTGFTVQAQVADNAPVNEELEELFARWSGNCDSTGTMSLWELCRLQERHVMFDGESFTVLSDVGAADKPIPLTIDVIDPLRVETPPEKMGDPLVRLGIEYNTQGRIVAYWIRKTHPYDTRDINLKFDRVSADRVLHVFDRWFAGQSRGWPWMTRVQNRVKDAKDLDEAAIIAAQVEACYAAFVRSRGSKHARALKRGTGTDGKGRRVQDIRPGTISYIDSDEEMFFSSPNRGGAQYATMQEWNYRRIAAGSNYPYEFLAGNWTGMSFAGGRLVLCGAKKRTRIAQKRIDMRWLRPIWSRLVDEAVMLDLVSIDPRLYARDPFPWRRHSWTPAAWDYAVNPGEEIDAQIKAVNENLTTKARVVAERTGENLEDVFDERSLEKQTEIDKKIVPVDEQAITNQPALVPTGAESV